MLKQEVKRVEREQLEAYLRDFLAVDTIKDYCPNGLQIEGRPHIQSIVTGVTACQELLERALVTDADAILVHHGYFWKGEPQPIKGMKKRRVQTLLRNDINLFAYHLPLDVHLRIGNNAQLARLMDWPEPSVLASAEPEGVVMYTELSHTETAEQVALQLETKLGRSLVCSVHESQHPVRKIAWCTGGGQGFIDLAAAAGCDLFITGEVSEPTVHSAREQGIAFFAAGHHATERYGIQALGEHLAEKFGLTHQFIDIDSPA
ncbi:Nif3-like dinuclear metal center hexameric protein [Pseudidiomarina terrestris]|uniref:Nif3-like dinuclear metal center hexameric protein n=1 Tax=Pseudidiomarina terrestris TaxID=2820060 RepID=UPI00264F9305|nr:MULTISPECIES: Nif3-like dinuclear metal center hexameric protein [unclassified Pseudidiomarina]MDN7135291.1 Nif3-like dinuclear metal center hexameric protein [Pseudidiomarina sp. 1ASP75-5]MEA3586939.1 Nif3-like dinuclear metal center hexameric protein [Pseudidiomarina sp. 1APP75-27a]